MYSLRFCDFLQHTLLSRKYLLWGIFRWLWNDLYYDLGSRECEIISTVWGVFLTSFGWPVLSSFSTAHRTKQIKRSLLSCKQPCPNNEPFQNLAIFCSAKLPLYCSVASQGYKYIYLFIMSRMPLSSVGNWKWYQLSRGWPQNILQQYVAIDTCSNRRSFLRSTRSNTLYWLIVFTCEKYECYNTIYAFETHGGKSL